MLEPHYIVTSNYEKSKCTIIRNPHIHMPTDIQDTTVEKITGNSLPIKWLGLSTFTAMDPDLMPGWRSNISQATWRGQKTEKKKKRKKKITDFALVSRITLYLLQPASTKLVCVPCLLLSWSQLLNYGTTVVVWHKTANASVSVFAR